MSLKIWLPLISDIYNQGASDIHPSIMGSGITYTTGKIGNAVTFPNSCASCIHMPGLKLQIFSWAAWFKVLGEGAGSSQRMLSEGRDTGSVGTNIWVSKAGTTLNWSTHKKSGQTAIELNRWYHVALTADGSNIKLYLDGILTFTTPYTEDSDYAQSDNQFVLGKMAYAYANTGNYFPFNGQLNDVRVYDHALSAAEVHEIAQGLVLHYKLDGGLFGNPNLVLGSGTATVSTNKWAGHSATGGNTSTIEYDNNTPCVRVTRDSVAQSSWDYLSYDRLLQSQIKTNTTYTITFDCKPDVDGSIGFTGFVNGNATNYLTASTTNIQNNCYANKWNHMIYKCVTKSSFDDLTIGSQVVYFSRSTSLRAVNVSVLFKNIKVEEGDAETPWCPADSELDIDRSIIEDSSGYNHNGTTLNTVEVSSDSPRYNVSTHLVNANSMINCGRGGMVTDSITVNLWIKSSAWGNPVSCTEGGGWNFEATGDYFRFPVYISGVGYKYGQTAHTRAQVCNNQWHMLTGVYDRLKQKVQIYVDGELDNEVSTGSSNNIGYNGSNVIWLGAEATGSATAASNGMAGLFSDFRIYCTPLLDTDIKQLYNVGMKVDNLGGVHSFELEENQQNKLYKTGILTMPNFYENDYKNILQYDQAIYTESDGSTWVHIFHHNNPANARFTNGAGDWSDGVYLDADRWYDVEKILNNLVQYEFLVKQKTTDTATETKWRWIQNINPLDATWETVDTDACIYNTSSGYSVSNCKKGMYLFKTSNLHMCIANNSKGNWYGGIGACSVYQNGIPGYPNTTVTTGYIDLYVRVYPNTSILKDFGFSANQFIEY